RVSTLPSQLRMSGVHTAVSMLELLGDRSPALNALGMGAAAFETWEGFHLERRREAVLEPLKHGPTGWATRFGGVLSGPAPLVLRLVASLSGSGKRRRA